MGDLLASVLPVAPPGPHARPPDRLPWDTAGTYWVGGVDCFYLSRAGPQLAEERAWGDIEDEITSAMAAAEKREKLRAGPGVEAGAAAVADADVAKGDKDAKGVAGGDAGFDDLYSGSTGAGAAAGTACGVAGGASASAGAGAGPSELVRVPHPAPLLLALVQRGHVLCDVPVLYVLPRDSKNAARRVFAGRQGGSFKTVTLPPELAAAVAAGAGGAE